MKEYRNVLYEVYTKFLLRIFLAILMGNSSYVVHTHSSYQKLNAPRRKTDAGQKTLSYVASSL